MGASGMQMFQIVLSNLTSLCLLMLIGYILRKTRIFTDEISAGLSAILLKVALPCTIVMSMQRDFTADMLAEGLIVFGVAFAMHFITVGIGIVLTKLCRIEMTTRGIWLFALSFANVAYMGYPVINAIYGDAAMFYVAMNNASFNLLFPTLGFALVVYGLPKKAAPTPVKRRALAPRPKRKIPINEALIATILGLFMFVTSTRLPAPVGNALSMAGSLMTPISMMIIGGLLAKNDFRLVFKDLKIYILAAVRLLVIPVAVFFVLRLFIQNDLMLGVMTYLTAMPAGAVLGIISVEKGADSFAASKVVFMTTVLSLFTIPLISLLLGGVS